jgi:hypothetical protein
VTVVAPINRYYKDIEPYIQRSRSDSNTSAIIGPMIPLVARNLSVCVFECLAEEVLLAPEVELETALVVD